VSAPVEEPGEWANRHIDVSRPTNTPLRRGIVQFRPATFASDGPLPYQRFDRTGSAGACERPRAIRPQAAAGDKASDKASDETLDETLDETPDETLDENFE
jgi:hypothetical protein